MKIKVQVVIESDSQRSRKEGWFEVIAGPRRSLAGDFAENRCSGPGYLLTSPSNVKNVSFFNFFSSV